MLLLLAAAAHFRRPLRALGPELPIPFSALSVRLGAGGSERRPADRPGQRFIRAFRRRYARKFASRWALPTKHFSISRAAGHCRIEQPRRGWRSRWRSDRLNPIESAHQHRLNDGAGLFHEALWDFRRCGPPAWSSWLVRVQRLPYRNFRRSYPNGRPPVVLAAPGDTFASPSGATVHRSQSVARIPAPAALLATPDSSKSIRADQLPSGWEQEVCYSREVIVMQYCLASRLAVYAQPHRRRPSVSNKPFRKPSRTTPDSGGTAGHSWVAETAPITPACGRTRRERLFRSSGLARDRIQRCQRSGTRGNRPANRCPLERGTNANTAWTPQVRQEDRRGEGGRRDPAAQTGRHTGVHRRWRPKARLDLANDNLSPSRGSSS